VDSGVDRFIAKVCDRDKTIVHAARVQGGKRPLYVTLEWIPSRFTHGL
jgi:hypothetical protein